MLGTLSVPTLHTRDRNFTFSLFSLSPDCNASSYCVLLCTYHLGPTCSNGSPPKLYSPHLFPPTKSVHSPDWHSASKRHAAPEDVKRAHHQIASSHQHPTSTVTTQSTSHGLCRAAWRRRANMSKVPYRPRTCGHRCTPRRLGCTRSVGPCLKPWIGHITSDCKPQSAREPHGHEDGQMAMAHVVYGGECRFRRRET